MKCDFCSSSGRQHDLSAFGCDMNQWNRLALIVSGQHADIFLNGQKAWTVDYAQPVGRIVGLHFMFYGCGAVDDISLADGDGRLVYSDDFEN